MFLRPLPALIRQLPGRVHEGFRTAITEGGGDFRSLTSIYPKITADHPILASISDKG